ncbi:MAG: hypothetical protein FWD52_00410 [Candidatus Bathyarchaeota archaeon]|nr:hypothetical protein [Candidatus Termiticorpusculum sp.]
MATETNGQIPIIVQVDDAEIEASIKLLDEALEKKQQLTNGNEGISTTAIAKKMDALNVLENKATTLEVEVIGTLGEVQQEMKGTEEGMRRIFRMIPGLREAQRAYISGNQALAGSISGAIGIAILAYNLAQKAIRYYNELKRKQEQYERDVMRDRGYYTKEQYKQWENEQKSGLNAARTKNTLR